jgi:hypothetical protein
MYLAEEVSIGVDYDLVLLTVEQDEFWENMNTLTLATLPRLQDRVAVVGYPVGGDTIFIKTWMVSRIEVGR